MSSILASQQQPSSTLSISFIVRGNDLVLQQLHLIVSAANALEQEGQALQVCTCVHGYI